MTAKPRTPQQDGGSFRLVAADVTAAKARVLLLPMLTICGCGWQWYGSASDGIQRIRRHRERMHPTQVDRGLKARKDAAKLEPKTLAATWDE